MRTVRLASSLVVAVLTFVAMAPASAENNDSVAPVPVAAAVGEDFGREIAPLWTALGMKSQHPDEGGTWEYGFQNAKVRSYYTVNKCHGSTVRDGAGRESRSVNTASGHEAYSKVPPAAKNTNPRTTANTRPYN
ncbi:lactococcin 972 family bacteriocin, partial [Rothia sp. 11254D007CT]